MKTKRLFLRPEMIVPLLIVLAALLPRIHGLGWGLPDVNEEATPFRRAWEIWGWGPARHFDPNPHFFNYPSLTIYIQFVGQALLYLILSLLGKIHSTVDFRVLYVTDPTAFLVMGRAITTLFAAGTVALIYRIGRGAAGAVCAAAAALLLALNPIHLAQSVVVEVDVPLAFFVTLSLFYALRILKEPSRGNHIAAGAAVGLAASTKYTGAFALLPILVAHLIARRDRSLRGKRARDGAAGPGSLAAGALAAVAVFAVTSPFVFLDAKAFWHDLSFEGEHMRLGHFGAAGSSTWFFYAEAMVKRLLGWPGSLLLMFGLFYLAAFRRRPWAVVSAALIVPMGLTICTWSMRADRYVIPIVPAALLVCGGTLSELSSWLGRRAVGTAARGAILVAATAVLILGTAGGFYVYQARLRPDPRTEARRWIQAHVPPGALVATETLGPDLLDPLHLAPLEPEVRDRILKGGTGRALYGVLIIPMFQVKPERSEVFYDPDLYEVADYVVTASQVGNRYRTDPVLYKRQLAFYDSLDARFERVAEFRSPPPHQRVVTIFHNPRQFVEFAKRRPVQGPVPLRPASTVETGEEAFFYYDMGLNYEAFGFLDAALASYKQALRYSAWRARVFGGVSVAMARCLLVQGRADEATRFLDAALARAPYPEDRGMIQQVLQRMAPGLPDRR